jgi:hypothetical protein
VRFCLASCLAGFGKFGNNFSYPNIVLHDSTQLNAAWQTKAHKGHRRLTASLRCPQVVGTWRCPPRPRRRCTFAEVQPLSQEDFAARTNPDPTSAEARSSINITLASSSSRWTKDDLVAGAELGVVASAGAIAGWLTGQGTLLGSVAALALFWLALAVACLREALRDKPMTRSRADQPLRSSIADRSHGVSFPPKILEPRR